MNKILIIDTTSNELFLSLIIGEKEDRLYIKDCNFKHSITMMPKLDELLKRNNITINDIDVFALSLGPGSFTGIRIGVTTIKGFIFGTEKKVISVNSLEANAYNYVDDAKEIVSIIDAKHNNAYVGKYEVVEGELIQRKLEFMDKIALKKEIENVDIFSSPYPNSFKAKETENYYDGFVELVKSKIAKGDFSTKEFAPLYLKRSQAEEEEDANKKVGKI